MVFFIRGAGIIFFYRPNKDGLKQTKSTLYLELV
jgi:hypothetical protein